MGYTPDYWKRNRDRILAQRRAKYEKDPDYRNKALKRAREYRERKKEEEGPPEEKPQIVTINGVDHAGYTTADIKDMIGLPESKTKYFQRQGYIPKALVTRPQRLYTKRQIDFLQELDAYLAAHRAVLRGTTKPEHQQVYDDLHALTDKIKQNWET